MSDKQPKPQTQSHKEFTQTEKARRGWWFSVVFLCMVVGLILFLTYVKIVDENRDVLIGILGVITGSISSMMAIASGRDPSEVEELKDKLASANSDREALIARLRDAQIQMQIKHDHLLTLQTTIIEKLSMLSGSPVTPPTEDEVSLHPDVQRWT
ncbi:MAG: hypothetical protein ACO3LT_01520 [Ilumatobacteraceae bacterium]|jgi:hypothetical protein